MTAGARLADVPLTTAEQSELDRLEDVVERGLDTFVEVGLALARIRDGRLYRQTHLSFERYLADRWDYSRSRAHRLIEAARITEMLPMGNKPGNERQARKLVGLSTEEATAVMTAATGNGAKKVTAKDIAAAREQVVDTRRAGGSVSPEPEPKTAVIGAEFFDSPAEAADVAAVGELTAEQFEEVIRQAHADGDLGREHVAGLARSSPRRKPLPDDADRAGWEIRKATERIERIVSDPRYRANEQQVALALRGHLLYVAETVAAVLDRLPSAGGSR